MSDRTATTSSQTFFISGNIAERDDKEKFNTEKLTEIVMSLGGTVFSGDVEKAVDASFVIVISQKLNKTLTMAYRLGWKIITKQFIIESRNTNTLPYIETYKLTPPPDLFSLPL